MPERDYFSEFHQIVADLFGTIVREERGKIEMAAEAVAGALMADRLLHVVGTGGHSSMVAEEMFYRTGGLVPVNPLLEQGFSVAHGALRSTMIERIPGYMIPLLDYYKVDKDDVLLIANAYGMNCATIDAAIEGKRRGAFVIGISSKEFSNGVPSDHPARHPTKQNLHEMKEVDVHIDCHMPYGDAVVSFEGVVQKVGPVSTLVNAFVVNELVVASVERMVGKGFKPPLWTSENVPEGSERNRDYKARYRDRIKHL